MDPIAATVCRVGIVYVYVLFAVRLSGKRTLYEATPLDLLTALILGDMFDGPLLGEVPLYRALICFTTVVALHMVIRYSCYRSSWIHRLVFSPPVEVLKDGHWVTPGLRRERVRQEEVLFMLRKQGLGDLKEVQSAALECGGDLSVTRRPAMKVAPRGDMR